MIGSSKKMTGHRRFQLVILTGRYILLIFKAIISEVGTISQSSSETPFKLSRFTVELGHLEKILFAQASACIASVNAKKSKWKIFNPSTYWTKCQNFRNPTNYISLDPEFYADRYLQEDYTLKSNCNKDMTRIRLSSGKFL